MKLVKLTTSAAKSTIGDVSWAPGTTIAIPDDERDTRLARPGLLHVYHGDSVDEALALGLMMDPIHARIGVGVRAFEVHGFIVTQLADLAGAHVLEVGDELRVSLPTSEQRIRCAIQCAQVAIGVGCPEWWSRWAERWLSGVDRSSEAARAAAWRMFRLAQDSTVRASAASWSAASCAARAAAWAQEVAQAAQVLLWASEAVHAAATAARMRGTSINLGALALRSLSSSRDHHHAAW